MSEENEESLSGCFGVIGAVFIVIGIGIVIAVMSGLYTFVMWCFE